MHISHWLAIKTNLCQWASIVGDCVEHSLYRCDSIILLLVLPYAFYKMVANLLCEALH